MAKDNTSIHPRRPRLADLGIKVPKDKDGAFRAYDRLDGLIIQGLPSHGRKRPATAQEAIEQ